MVSMEEQKRCFYLDSDFQPASDMLRKCVGDNASPYHFNCGECSNWWSYAGTLEHNELRPPTMTCPHCGYKTKIKLKEGFKGVNG